MNSEMGLAPMFSSVPRRTLQFLRNLSLRARLLLSFVAIVLFVGIVSASLGIGLIHRTMPQVQNVLAVDLNAACDFYRQYLSEIGGAARLLAQRRMLKEDLSRGELQNLAAPFDDIRQSEDLDILVLTDLHGGLLFPPQTQGKVISPSVAFMVKQAVRQRKEISSTLVLTKEELEAQGIDLAERAHIDLVSTPYASNPRQSEMADGLIAAAAIPVISQQGRLLAVLFSGRLLNRRNTLTDRIKSSLYRGDQFQERDVAVVSIFLGEKRIATTATTSAGDRAIGTLASADVYNQVVRKGERWIKPGYIVDDWYLTAYEPIRDLRGQVIGALGLGLMERKFEDAQRRVLLFLLALTIAAVLLAILMSWWLSNSIMKPVTALITATQKIAAPHVPQPIRLPRQLQHAPPEIEALGQAFNEMALAIHERDQQLHRQTHEKLMRSDRLAMIGQLAAGVAHEINNPLGSILLFSRLILQQAPTEGRTRENLERIEKETKRCHTIVKSLLDFARERKPLVESVDTNQLLDATLKLFEGQFLFQNVHVVRDYDSHLPAIQADQSQLQQVLMNIILNAADAMNGKGQLTLSTRPNDADGTIEIRISDTGCGIPPENIERIFDPFFTTKGVGHGTGLGLSVSYGIIQSHNGEISVSSEIGRGTTFTISLPADRRIP